MARLNPVPTRSSTRERSIYRDPTPDQSLRPPRHADANGKRASPGALSDKENRVGLQALVAQKSQALAAQSDLFTPSVEPTPRGNKRRRLGERNSSVQSMATRSEVDHNDDIEDLQFYDPDQDEDLRREVRQGLRNSMRDLRENREEVLRPENNDLERMFEKQNRIMHKVRQTTDATLDSRFLVEHSSIALKKVTNAATSDTAAGIDIDEFVSKCITFMRLGGTAPEQQDDEHIATQSRRTRRQMRVAEDEDDEDEEDADNVLDWEVFGERVCVPNVRRPPLPGFLLGPLSVQKRVRQSQARAPRQRREDQGPVTKPQELQAQDLQAAENSNVTTFAANIRKRLQAVLQERSSLAEAEVETWPQMSEEEMSVKQDELLAKYHLSQDGGISYFPFIVNPHSFGQTIENLFYVSFLIKDSMAAIRLDDNQLPVLYCSQPRSLEQQREQNAARHQAIFTLDYATWQKLVEAYDLQEPMIPHRNDEQVQTITASGWYG